MYLVYKHCLLHPLKAIIWLLILEGIGLFDYSFWLSGYYIVVELSHWSTHTKTQKQVYFKLPRIFDLQPQRVSWSDNRREKEFHMLRKTDFEIFIGPLKWFDNLGSANIFTTNLPSVRCFTSQISKPLWKISTYNMMTYDGSIFLTICHYDPWYHLKTLPPRTLIYDLTLLWHIISRLMTNYHTLND